MFAPNLQDFTKEEIKETLKEVRHPVEVAIVGSDNYFNLGAIIRTCHQFLVKKIWAVDCTEYYPKATMGLHKWEDIQHATIEEFISLNWERSLISFERRSTISSEDLRTFSYPQNPILVFGSEKFGVPERILTLSKEIVSIPQYGLQNDLSLSVATGIVLYDWIKKYYESEKK